MTGPVGIEPFVGPHPSGGTSLNRTATDVAGSNDGTLRNVDDDQFPKVWSTDVPTAIDSDYSVLLDGIDDLIDLGNIAAINGLTAFSVSLWVKNSNLSSDATAVGRWRLGDNQFLLYLDTDGAGDGYRFIVRDSGATSRATSADATNATQDIWQHVVGTYSSSGIKVYVDSALSDSATGGSAVRSTDIGVAIGADDATGSSRIFQGNVDDVRIYAVELTSAQVSELYAGSEATGATPISHYPLDDGPSA